MAVLQQQADAKDALVLQLDIVMREKEMLMDKTREIDPLRRRIEEMEFEKEQLGDEISSLKLQKESNQKQLETYYEMITELKNRILDLTRENDEYANRTTRMEDIVNHYTENMAEAKQKYEEVSEKLRTNKDLLVQVGEKLEARIRQCEQLETNVSRLTTDLESAVAESARSATEWEVTRATLQSDLDETRSKLDAATEENAELKVCFDKLLCLSQFEGLLSLETVSPTLDPRITNPLPHFPFLYLPPTTARPVPHRAARDCAGARARRAGGCHRAREGP